MKREEARKKAEIMLAYANGKEIEFYNDEYKTWVSINDLSFDGYVDYYRVKQEPKYRPFKDANECFEEMKKHEPFGWIISRKGEMSNLLYISSNGIVIYQSECRFNRAVIDYVFADGTPFGIKVEEESK